MPALWTPRLALLSTSHHHLRKSQTLELTGQLTYGALTPSCPPETRIWPRLFPASCIAESQICRLRKGPRQIGESPSIFAPYLAQGSPLLISMPP